MCEEMSERMSTNVIISRIPSFIQKLWIIVNDPSTDHLICWDQKGHSFHLLNPNEFAKTLLPRYFRHSKLPSFVRQLNLYGFRKVTDLEQGLLQSDSMQYLHPDFSRGAQADLMLIRRNTTSIGRGVPNTPNSRPAILLEDIESASDPDTSVQVGDIKRLKQQVNSLELTINDLKYENSRLSDELNRIKATHNNQHQILSKIASVLATFFGSGDPSFLRGDLRIVPQLLECLPRPPEEEDLPVVVSSHPNKALVVDDLSSLNQTCDTVMNEWQVPNNHVFDVNFFKNKERNVVRVVEEKEENSKKNTWKYNRETNSFGPW